MGKNSQIHLVLETRFLNYLKEQAEEKGITISEFCRQKLKQDPQLDKIEIILNKINKKIFN